MNCYCFHRKHYHIDGNDVPDMDDGDVPDDVNEDHPNGDNDNATK